MEPVSSAAAILQLLGNAIKIALNTAIFVKNVKNAEEFQDDFIRGLDYSFRAVERMTAQVEDRDVADCYDKAVQERREISKLVHEIAKDCKKCNDSLHRLYGTFSNTLTGRVTAEARRVLRRPQIETVNARLRSNVGNIQALISVLQVIANNHQTEQVKDYLREIQEKLISLQESRAEIMAALNNLNNREEVNRIDDGSGLIHQICDEIVLSRDAGTCIKITEGTFKTAKSIYDRLSRDGSVQNSSPSDRKSDGDDSAYGSSVPQLEPNTSTSVPLSTMTVFLDGYIHETKTEFENCGYEKCKKYIHEALEWGECRYFEHNVDFHQWFDLQLLLAEVYEKEGSFQDARSYISFLWQLSETHTVDYQQMSNLQEVQLRCATARLFLLEYEREPHNTSPDKLKHEALSAFGAAITAFREAADPEEESASVMSTLRQLLVDSAATLDKVFGILADPVGQRSLRVEYPLLLETLPVLEPIMQPTRGTESEPPIPHPVLDRPQPPKLRSPGPASTSGSSDGCGTSPVSHRTDVTRLSEDSMSTGASQLLGAAKMQNFEALKNRINEFGPYINAKDSAGMNALHHALTRLGREDVVKLLIDNDIDVNAKDNHGDTPLHYCVRRSNYHGAQILLSKGKAAIDCVNKTNQTPAKLAIDQSSIPNRDILQLLIHNKADFDWPGIPRGIRDYLRELGYESNETRGDSPVTTQTLENWERRNSRASQSSHTSNRSRWYLRIGRIPSHNT
ncbi:hypothetical protein TSTA_048690 [Talaromyces stipitatus ATCC 10500]|uniref:Uncharacterized protein n=1 Tax=Talaromyces stipitatus (strain ATCC 10500 / CBS 375.48 / QM 6759 / NRRL 1006) TaxID=441959 RepID=B8ML13_TALSN|nr:uncharacterized protein TSTA_048690 [Talaromyces stipitatus ATCC 10500]EED15429.1 hypothetical protein TSTA_048690 [Talaromyces stipitatus ATCC 10500]